jgi:hypothetical protein
MQGSVTIAKRSTQLAVLTAALVLGIAASAQASAGDDAHFIPQTTSAENAGVATTNAVPCPGGERAIGGGVRFFSFPKTLTMRRSGPVGSDGSLLDDTGAPSKWSSTIVNGGSSSVTMISYAICSASTDATQVREATFATGTDANGFNTGHTTVSCPTGQRAIGGGLVPQPGSLGFSMANGPVDETGTPSSTVSGDIPRGWFVAVNATGGNLGEQYRAYVICSTNSTATIQLASVIASAGQGQGSGVSVSTGVDCPTGQRALSGGIIDNAAYAWMIGSAPGGAGSYASSVNPGIATGWRGFIWSQVGNGVEFKVAAVCEAASSPATPPPPIVPADPSEPLPPSNVFTIGKFFRDKDKGTGAVVLNVPGPGTVALQSSKLRSQGNVATEAGEIGLSVLPRSGKPKHKLRNTGKLKAKTFLKFTPEGGTTATQKDKLKLVLN